MADDVKIYTPEVIQDSPFPQEAGAEQTTTEGSGATLSPTETKDTPLPVRRIAAELIGASFNTKSRKILAEFQFTESGALQIGKYLKNLSGDLRISPNGIIARNSSGNTTFAIDGDTGDATFAGTILAGAVIAAAIDGDLITAGTIDANRIKTSTLDAAVDVGTGASSSYVRLDGVNNRIIVHDGTNPRIVIGNV